jgi:hypothetical protein
MGNSKALAEPASVLPPIIGLQIQGTLLFDRVLIKKGKGKCH